MLLIHPTRSGDKRLFFTDDTGRRRALLKAFAANQFAMKKPTPENLGLMKSYVDAYNLPTSTVETMGVALAADIIAKRDFVEGNLTARMKEYEAVTLRDTLLALPVEEAVNHTSIIEGIKVNSVDWIAPILDKIYQNKTSDGYTSDKLFEIENAELA